MKKRDLIFCGFELKQSTRARLGTLARRDNRSVSAYLRTLVERHVARADKAEQGQKRVSA